MAKPELLQYTAKDRKDSQRPAEERIKDHWPIEPRLLFADLIDEASRCGQCGVPSCHTGLSSVYTGCPLENNIPDIHKLAASGDLEAAYKISSSTNPMGAVTGRVCPSAKSLCESSCVLNENTGSGHGYVSIRRIENAVHDLAWENGWIRPIKPLHDYKESIGIIGSGPGGYAAAEGLRKLGYNVTIYERSPVAGGLLTIGIPEFKLEKKIVDRHYKYLEEGGVTIKCNSGIGDTIKFEQLLKEHQAIIIATGKYKPKDPRLEGSAKDLATPTLEYLARQNLLNRGIKMDDRYPPEIFDAKGKTVLVNGGGDTAMDCVRTAIRQGAKKVICLYRRDAENMPGSEKEFQAAKAEGVEFRFMHQVKAADEMPGGGFMVKGVKTALGAPDSSGRQGMVETDETFEIQADIMINAIGFDPENLPVLFNVSALPVTRRGTLDVQNPVLAPHSHVVVGGLVTVFERAGNTIPVFAVGDIAGSNLVVEALKGGRDIAPHVHKALRSP
ncbi:MAG: dihydropyrimidine dehydrogenase [Alphaproteobacteria bacterium CG_4_9_14_3_um_filter_47_13]|nr:MAG: dihydropyrimidine dehydrogenase [Alphaproteobacteria bacterium CG_4_9_14_3_um_filter_47_13]